MIFFLGGKRNKYMYTVSGNEQQLVLLVHWQVISHQTTRNSGALTPTTIYFQVTTRNQKLCHLFSLKTVIFYKKKRRAIHPVNDKKLLNHKLHRLTQATENLWGEKMSFKKKINAWQNKHHLYFVSRNKNFTKSANINDIDFVYGRTIVTHGFIELIPTGGVPDQQHRYLPVHRSFYMNLQSPSLYPAHPEARFWGGC